MRLVKLSNLVSAAALLLPIGLPAAAQTAGEVTLVTAYPGVVVEAGSTASFTFAVEGSRGAQADLDIDGLPKGWVATFRGDNSTVSRVAVTGSEDQEVRLEVQIPAGAPEGETALTVAAGASRTPITITVQAGAGGEVTLTPDFPGLRGASDAEFPFQVTVRNETPTEVELQFEGTGPEGWLVTAEPTGQARASAITVGAGQSSTVRLTAKPPVGAEAGLYDIGMTATGDGVEATLSVKVEIIGDFALDLTTFDQRLNAEVTKGEPTELALRVVNSGSAPLLAIGLTASPPSGWDVTFSQDTIESLPPGEIAEVTATISASDAALAGDYDISFTATTDQASDSVSIRTTVTPSAAWGLVGVGVIALTFAGLAYVFRKFGRR
jgi:uncharacterized membrane protein